MLEVIGVILCCLALALLNFLYDKHARKLRLEMLKYETDRLTEIAERRREREREARNAEVRERIIAALITPSETIHPDEVARIEADREYQSDLEFRMSQPVYMPPRVRTSPPAEIPPQIIEIEQDSNPSGSEPRPRRILDLS